MAPSPSEQAPGWSERELDGFVLALLVHRDPEREPADLALTRPMARAIRARRAALEGLSRRERQRWVRDTLAAAPEPAVEQAGRPPRALSLLSARAPAGLRRPWLSGAPLPRAGYVPPASLSRLLHRLASKPAAPQGGT